MSFRQWRSPRINNTLGNGVTVSAVLTGTAVPTITEADIVTGGFTIIATITGDTLVSAGASFDGARQAFIDGSDGSGSEPGGWDAVVRATEAVTAIVRTSDTVVTWTLSAFPSFDITATDTISLTIPGSILTSGIAIVATPTFTVTAAAGAGNPFFYYAQMRRAA